MKVKEPQLWLGKGVQLDVQELKAEDADQPNGAAILQAFRESDNLNIPRKSHEELMRELREVRE